MTAGPGRILTAKKRDSKRPEALRINRGWETSGMPRHGSHTMGAKSWQPLQIPRLKVSGRSTNSSNCRHRSWLKRMTPAQPLAESSTSA